MPLTVTAKKKVLFHLQTVPKERNVALRLYPIVTLRGDVAQQKIARIKTDAMIGTVVRESNAFALKICAIRQSKKIHCRCRQLYSSFHSLPFFVNCSLKNKNTFQGFFHP